MWLIRLYLWFSENKFCSQTRPGLLFNAASWSLRKQTAVVKQEERPSFASSLVSCRQNAGRADKMLAEQRNLKFRHASVLRLGLLKFGGFWHKITKLSFFTDLDHYHHGQSFWSFRLPPFVLTAPASKIWRAVDVGVVLSTLAWQPRLRCCLHPPKIENMTAQEYPALVLPGLCYTCFRQQLTPVTKTKILVQPQFLQPVWNKLTSCIGLTDWTEHNESSLSFLICPNFTYFT